MGWDKEGSCQIWSKEVIDGETERLKNMWRRKKAEIKGLLNKAYDREGASA